MYKYIVWSLPFLLVKLFNHVAFADSTPEPDTVYDNSNEQQQQQQQQKPPNLVLFVTDQERAPTAYEDDRLKSFRSKHLHGYRELGCADGEDDDSNAGRTRCIQFTRHYTSSTACEPSRANLFTGQYATVHGVRTTDLDVLDPSVPTMGHYFETAGYETRYFGKWHLSEADLHDGKPTWPVHGERDLDAEGEYLRADPLSKFGFHGWIGPEPHGFAKSNTAVWRDPQIVQQTLEWIRNKNRTATTMSINNNNNKEQQEQKPFLLVVNIVNPHDICLWPVWDIPFGFDTQDETVPPIPAPPTLHEDLTNKPSTQKGWKRFGSAIFGSGGRLGDYKTDRFRRFYYQMQKLADKHIATIVQEIKSTPFWDDTIFVRTSDHGEMLGAHGLLQKWYSAYDEVLKVPLVISSPRFAIAAGDGGGRGGGGNGGRPSETKTATRTTIDFPTSSVDILPTMLSLAGLDEAALREKIARQYVETHPLVGEDLTKFFIIPNGVSNSTSKQDRDGEEFDQVALEAKHPTAVYSYVADDISLNPLLGTGILHHPHWVPRLLSKLYHFKRDPIQGPKSMEAVIAVIGDGTVWKLVRFFDDPELWTFPYENDTTIQVAGIWAGQGTVKVRTTPFEEQWELYDLSNDPYEIVNLAHENVLLRMSHDKRLALEAVKTNLEKELNQLRREKSHERRTPLPKVHRTEEHLLDFWDLLSESYYGPVGPIVVGVILLVNTISYQEPVLGGVLVLGTVIFGIVSFVACCGRRPLSYCSRGEDRKQKEKMA